MCAQTFFSQKLFELLELKIPSICTISGQMSNKTVGVLVCSVCVCVCVYMCWGKDDGGHACKCMCV